METSPAMPARMLSDRLRMLEERGFVERAVYSEHPLRAEYRLTELGRTMQPVIEALFRWGLDHTLDGRERRIVLEHLYGDVPPAPASRLKFPSARPAGGRRRRT
jgi:DNA-binding HxlR family transcriptional regulator